MTNIADAAKTWLFKIALKKVVKRAIPWVVSFGLTIVKKVNASAGSSGVTLSVDEVALSGAIASGISFIQNWVKTKFDIKWL